MFSERYEIEKYFIVYAIDENGGLYFFTCSLKLKKTCNLSSYIGRFGAVERLIAAQTAMSR